MLNFRNTRDTWVKFPHQLFEKPGFQKQILGCNKCAKSNHNLYFISENLQEMDIVHSTDRYTLIEQSVNHKSTLIEQSLHCCFVAEFRPPAPRTHFQRTRNIIRGTHLTSDGLQNRTQLLELQQEFLNNSYVFR